MGNDHDDPDPGDARLNSVARWLRLSRDAAQLSYGQLAKATGYSTSTLHRAVKGTACTWEIAVAIASACGGDIEELREVWTAERSAKLTPRKTPSPNSVYTAGELRVAMRELLTLSGLSLRQLERLAGVGALPRSTVNHVLKGNRPPREALLRTFVHTLGAGDEISDWLAALKRAQQASPRRLPSNPVSVTPSPRLLSVLGDIPMSDEQCFGELIDNSLQALTQGAGSTKKTHGIFIDFEDGSGTHPQSSITIRDSGDGIGRGALLPAISAGWSGSFNVHHRLGIGFNIAIARLGWHITIRSANATDPNWTVATLNLRTLAQNGEWLVPVWTESKNEPSDHGTQITITGLREPWSQGRIRHVRRLLGDLYSYPIRLHNLHLEVNGTPVQPRLPCIWDESRTVISLNTEISAVQRFDVPLPDAAVCTSCHHVNKGHVNRCGECDGQELRRLQRRVNGWIGVQRYAHGSDYGLDFLHHGRKILIRDKSMFEFHNLDSASREMEYPIDGNRGRIVGEIHCDHVPVSYLKGSLDLESPEWIHVVRAIRGDGPLSPYARRRAGYSPEQNQSPLGKIFNAFRRTDPGLRFLVPGDGKRALHAQAEKWGRAFHQGDPAYQSDELWYEAAKSHDALRSLREH
ncbi:helix-turn-helix domain-containing protein [Streptomyces sp. NPDC059985]|uniref:helix-turn-helix domain-containing protein n=1 Tax=Streptomyces sp. NPDC059985 TaxID=3347025 RepID=UPI00369B25F3